MNFVDSFVRERWIVVKKGVASGGGMSVSSEKGGVGGWGEVGRIERGYKPSKGEVKVITCMLTYFLSVSLIRILFDVWGLY